MSDRKLSPHFWLREFLRSATASRMGRPIEWPPEYVEANLERLCTDVLEPVRKAIGKPFTILSGYRPVWLNTAVGGSSRSDHLTGRAADIIVAGMSNEAVCQRIMDMGLPFRQLILEFPPNGWVHVSIGNAGTAKQEVLTASKQGKATVYMRGLQKRSLTA